MITHQPFDRRTTKLVTV